VITPRSGHRAFASDHFPAAGRDVLTAATRANSLSGIWFNAASFGYAVLWKKFADGQ